MLSIPPFLQELGYANYDVIKELDKRTTIEYENHIEFDRNWSEWRGILEYLCCVEYSRIMLLSLPKGNQIGSHCIVPARYNSSSLIFLAQASQDNIAVWINEQFGLHLTGSNIALHKDKFRKCLIEANNEFIDFFNSYSSFQDELNNFRMAWIHKLSGGANVFADAPPGSENSNVQIAVPIDPLINLFKHDSIKYLEKIEKCRKENSGKWLYEIDDFANRFTNGTRDSTLRILEICLSTIKS